MLRIILSFFVVLLSYSLSAKDTELKLYRPFDERTSVVIKGISAGQCWHQSQRIKRQDAWRCVVDTKVYDPCFIKEYGLHQEAVCPSSPWVNEGLQINLSTPINNNQHIALDMSEAYPWAIELNSGEHCLAVDEGKSYDNLQVQYSCNNQTLLIGHVQRCDPAWSILKRTNEGITTALIAKAWF